MQELSPELVATHSEAASVVEGHPFIVEAGVSLGGKAAREGVTVYRFANRIPLLFEGGGDVVTRTAMKRIKWVPIAMHCLRLVHSTRWLSSVDDSNTLLL